MRKKYSNNKSEKFCDTFEEHKFILNNLDEIVWAISWPDLEVKFISKAVKDIVGYTVNDFKNDPLLLQKITHPADIEINEQAINNLKEKGYSNREFRIITKSDQVKWIHDKGKIIYDEDNNPIRVEGVMRDITQRKKTEKKLEYNENRYQTIFNSAPIGFMLEDEKGNILEVNEVMCEDSGYSKEELKGSNILDKFVLQEYQELAKENIKKLMQGKELEFDIKTPTKDGQIKYYHLKETDINLPDGSKGIISMHLDITERVKQRKKLEMMNFSINKAELLIFRVNPDGIIEYANETVFEQLGYARDELIGLKAENIIRSDYYIGRKKYWNKLKSAKSLRYEFSYISNDNSYIPVEITSQYFQYEDREYEFIFAQNITKRIEKEKEIKYLAYRDSLTDLYNRKFFKAEIERLDTSRQMPISIIMGDLNGLKIINDSYGQKIGDQLLIKTAKLLKEVVREDDILARYGGDEFTILLPQTTNKTAKKIVKRIKLRNREENTDEIPISISFGVATKKSENQKITEIIKRAEDEMYQNKLSESRSSKSNIVQGLLNTLSSKSSETKEHAIRMTKTAFDFGEKLELPNYELNRLSLLATLHDIGKTTIPEDILKKPAKLNDNEWRLIKEHSKRGSKIAAASEEFVAIADEILYHHEHWAGSGYPDGLEGEEIPYLARIITIIDSYDVMTNDRPYSKAISKREALEEIKRCAGSQFDPKLASLFIEMVLEN